MSPTVDLPTGTVTFVFTDIEGSTRLLQRLGDSYRSLLEQYRSIVEKAVEATGGIVVDIEGDGFFLAFRSAVAAVACATRVQRTLATESWPEDVTVRVRIGIHSGEGRPGGTGYVGMDVHRAARIAASGHGGQTLLSDPTAKLTQFDLPEGTFLEDLGAHSMKDLVHDEHLYQLGVAGLPNSFPPLATSTGIKGNLPQRTVSFVGRRDDINRVSEAVGSHRLVTLTGSGGVGKTSLALAAAPQMSTQFPDGIWVVEVSRIVDGANLAIAIAHQLRITESPGHDLVDTIASRLARAKALLILDGCEHLVGPVARLAETLLRSTHDMHLMVTSREWLSIRGEVLVHVPPMTVPTGDAGSIAELGSYDSVALFVARARAVQPAFELNPRNAPAVAEICRRLDGIPLAIELAAARLKVLSPWQVVERLDQQFALLASRHRDVAPRQQTLETTLDWSHDALEDDEQILFARLSVFAGGFTLEQTEEVCSAAPLDRHGVLDLLGRLVETSLVETAETEPVRYRLLEPVAQYARQRLEELGESDAVRARHAATFTALAEKGDLSLLGPDQTAWIARLQRERHNLRAALRTLQERRDAPGLVRLAGALRWFWVIRRDVSEGWSWLRSALENREGSSPGHIARALNGLGLLATRRLDLETAESAFSEALDIYRGVGDGKGEARQTYHLAMLAWFRDRAGEADELGRQAEDLSRRHADDWALAWTLAVRGTMARLTGDLATARRAMDESHAVFTRHAGLVDQGWSMLRLGALARDEGNYALAADMYAQGSTALARVGDTLGVAHAEAGLGALEWLAGNHEHALALYRKVLVGFSLTEEASNNLFELKTMIQGNPSTTELQAVVETNRSRAELTEEASGQRAALAEYLYHIGATALGQQGFERASTALIESLTLAIDSGDLRGIRLALHGLAAAFAGMNRCELASSVLGAASSRLLPPVHDRPEIDTEALSTDLRRRLEADVFDGAFAAGTYWTPSQALHTATQAP